MYMSVPNLGMAAAVRMSLACVALPVAVLRLEMLVEFIIFGSKTQQKNSSNFPSQYCCQFPLSC